TRRIEDMLNPSISDLARLYGNSTPEELFEYICRITDDTGRDYSSIIHGRCLPHSAVRELKSKQN
ncbi:hypothetical protein, partial [Klebsiella pneumoniae]|uniref:hypothetical protein n=1 Tax=Klebsiella pneumoniae TaxID=573 RepID=UPI001C9AF171